MATNRGSDIAISSQLESGQLWVKSARFSETQSPGNVLTFVATAIKNSNIVNSLQHLRETGVIHPIIPPLGNAEVLVRNENTIDTF